MKFKHKVLTVAGNLYSISSVISDMEEYFSKAEEVLIIATEKLKWDIEKLKIPQTNISIEAKTLEITGECTISTSAPD